MTDAQATASRCGTCGADLPAEGAPCPSCATAAPTEEAVAELAAVTAAVVAAEPASCEAEEPECPPGSLWVRVAVAALYLVLAAAFAYGSVTFFDGGFSSSSDWVFGAMSIALSLVALVGVKESLFPSKWTPE
jgi:hypothetical protein